MTAPTTFHDRARAHLDRLMNRDEETTMTEQQNQPEPPEYRVTWTGTEEKGRLVLDGHDITRHVLKEGMSLGYVTNEHGRESLQLQVGMITRSLDVDVVADRVVLNTSHEVEALLKAGGWAKKGDVSVNADVLAATVDVLRVVAEALTEQHHGRRREALRRQADQLAGFVNPLAGDQADIPEGEGR